MAVFAWGSFFYGNGFYLVALSAKHGWAVGVISSAITVAFLMCIPAAIAVGLVFDLHGRRWGALGVTLYGAIALSGGIFGLAHVSALWQLYLAYALLGSAYPALAAPGITATLTQRVSQGYGWALSIALTGGSVGGAVAAPLLVWASAAFGLESALEYLSALIIGVLVPLGLWVQRPIASATEPEEKLRRVGGTGQDPNAVDQPQSGAQQVKRALASAAFKRIVLAALLSLIAQVGFLAHQLSILQVSLNVQDAALVITLTAIASVFGRFLVGALSTRVRLDRLAVIAYTVQGIGIAGVAFAGQTQPLVLGCVVTGFFVGAVVMLPPMLCRASFAVGVYGRVYGFVAIGVYLGGGLGSSLAGVIRDYADSYLPALLALSVISLTAAAVVRGLLAPPR